MKISLRTFCSSALILALHNLNTSAQQIITNIVIPSSAQYGLSVNPALNKIYTSGGASSGQTVSVVDGTTFAQVNVGSGAGAKVDVTNNNYWAAGVFSANAIVRAGATDATVTNIALANCPIETAVDAKNRRAWVIGQCGPGNDPLWALNADTYAIITGPISIGSPGGGPLVPNPLTGKLYFTSAGISKRINPSLGYALTTNSFGAVLGVNEQTGRLYANGGSTLQILDGTIDPETVVSNVSLSFNLSSAIGVNPVLNRIYAGKPGTNQIAILNGTNGQTIGTISLDTNITSVGVVVVDSTRSRVYAIAYSSSSTYLYAILDSGSAPVPTITSFTPSVGPIGTLVAITGANLGGATNVTFSSVSSTFTNISANQISAVVPAGATTGLIVVKTPGGVATSANAFAVDATNATVIGPLFPPPLGVSFSQSGSIGDGAIGRASGKTWFFQNVLLANSAIVFWGATNHGVGLSFDDGIYTEPPTTSYSEILTYQPSLSSLSGGVVVWTGETRLPGNPTPVYSKFTLTVRDFSSNPLPLASATSVGLSNNIGGVVLVTPGLNFTANLKFEASYSSNSSWSPALDFYDAQTVAAGSAFSSFAGGFYFENTPPIVTGLSNQIANQVTSPGTLVGPYPFTLNDTETGQGSLIISATSSNHTILADANVFVDKLGGQNGQVRTYPETNQVGTTLITVLASDGYSTNSGSFVLTLNSPPTISPISNKKTNKNTTSGPHNFTVGDLETSASSLTLSAASTNTTLVPNTNIVFGGSASNRTVTITPISGLIGTTLITLTVSDGMASNSTSFSLLVNDPPHLDQNTTLNLAQGASAVIGNSLLFAFDTESPPTQLTYTIAPGGSGGPTHEGVLKIAGTNLVAGSTFTEDDIDNNRLSYVNGGGCETNDDFQFNVADADGGVTPTGAFTAFTFHIKIAHGNYPPVALSSSGNLSLGQTIQSSFNAIDTNCPPIVLTFSILTNGVKGTATLTNANTGGFTYTANSGQTGVDTLVFKVDNGFLNSTGTVTLTISNRPPVSVNGSGITLPNIPFHGSVAATDADLPPQTLTFGIATNGSQGTATITNTLTGGFVYVPNLNVLGADTFVFTVSDGFLSSQGTFTVTMTNQPPAPINGSGTTLENVPFLGTVTATDPDLPAQALTFSLATNGSKGTVTITNAATGGFVYTPNLNAIGADTFIFSVSDGFLSSQGTFTVTIHPTLDPGDIVVADSANKSLVLVNPAGTQFVLSQSNLLSEPRGVAFEPSGNLVVLDFSSGVVRVNPTNGTQTLISSATNFSTSPVGPVGIAVEKNGSILVADGVNGLVRVNPTNGSVSTVSSGGSMFLPEGVTIAPNGDIYVADVSAFLGNPSRILRVNPTNGAQTIVTIGGNLIAPLGIVLDNHGGIVLSDVATFAGGPYDSVIRVDPLSGTQTVIATNTLLHVPTGVGLMSGGRIITANNQSANLVQISSNGVESVFTSGGNLNQPFGLAVVHKLVLFSPVITNNFVTFNIFGEPGETYFIENSSNLFNWGTLGSVSNATGTIQFTAPLPPAPQQFYRGRAP